MSYDNRLCTGKSNSATGAITGALLFAARAGRAALVFSGGTGGTVNLLFGDPTGKLGLFNLSTSQGQFVMTREDFGSLIDVDVFITLGAAVSTVATEVWPIDSSPELE